LLGHQSRELLEDILDSKIGDESKEKLIQFSQNQRYLEGPRSWTKPWSKTRNLSPWYYCGSMAISMDPWHYGGPTRLFSMRDLISPSNGFFAYKYCNFRPETGL